LLTECRIDGRSNAPRTKFARPKGVNKFVFRDCVIYYQKQLRHVKKYRTNISPVYVEEEK